MGGKNKQNPAAAPFVEANLSTSELPVAEVKQVEPDPNVTSIAVTNVAEGVTRSVVNIRGEQVESVLDVAPFVEATEIDPSKLDADEVISCILNDGYTDWRFGGTWAQIQAQAAQMGVPNVTMKAIH